MADKTFEILKRNEGRLASINGATQIRAGVIRPEVIITRLEDERKVSIEKRKELPGMNVGSPVRVIREPNFGALAKVVSLPVEPTPVETEAKVRVVEIQLENGKKIVLPRANVELIEV